MSMTYAQTDEDAFGKIHIKHVTEKDKEILDQGRPTGPKEVPTPQFVMKSDNNAFMMTVGGNISPVLGWDFGDNMYTLNGLSFITQSIPVPAQAGHKGDFFLSALNSNVTFQVVGFGGTDNQVSGFVKIGTNCINNNLQLKNAFVTWKGFTIGKMNTLMQDGNACQPPTIDQEGPSGELSASVYEVNYTSKTFGGGFQAAIGLDIPTYYSSNGVYRGEDFKNFEGHQLDTSAEQYVPDIPAWIQYTFSENNRIRISGLLRNFAYRDLLNNKTQHTPGWGAMLSGNFSPCKSVIGYVQMAYGKGIGAYLQDLGGLPLSYIPKDSQPGKMEPVPMMGAVVGFTFNINPRWQVNIMASESRIWDVATYAKIDGPSGSDNYKYALYGAANIFYNITNYLQWGVEGVWGHRETWSHTGASVTRVQTQLQFSF